MTKKFLTVMESALTRFARGGFLVGDVVKFKDGFAREDAYKALGSNVHDAVKAMIDSGMHIRVVGINDDPSPRYPGNPETMTGNVVLNIALDNGGGRYTDYCTIPSCCVEPVHHYPNLAPLPDNMVRPNGTVIKPQEYEYIKDDKLAADQTMHADQNGKKKKVTITLPSKNTRIKAVTPKGATTPAVHDYAIKYLEGM